MVKTLFRQTTALPETNPTNEATVLTQQTHAEEEGFKGFKLDMTQLCIVASSSMV